MLLKKINNITIFIFFLTTSLVQALEAKEIKNNIIKDYFFNFNEFSSSFMQTDNISTEIGKIYIKDKRIRIEYNEPTKILIIIARGKAMYFNQDLKEVEYINTKNSLVEVFYEIFYDPNFFIKAVFVEKKNLILLEKKIILSKNKNINLKVIFEKNPLNLKKIILKNTDGIISYYLLNPEFFLEYEKDFFSMANPLLK